MAGKIQTQIDDPDNVVQWEDGFLPGRCGMLATGRIAKGYCGKLFQFRGCRISGRLIMASVCNECADKHGLGTAVQQPDPQPDFRLVDP